MDDISNEYMFKKWVFSMVITVEANKINIKIFK